jgi:hypothetical protein
MQRLRLGGDADHRPGLPKIGFVVPQLLSRLMRRNWPAIVCRCARRDDAGTVAVPSGLSSHSAKACLAASLSPTKSIWRLLSHGSAAGASSSRGPARSWRSSALQTGRESSHPRCRFPNIPELRRPRSCGRNRGPASSARRARWSDRVRGASRLSARLRRPGAGQQGDHKRKRIWYGRFDTRVQE